MVDGRHPSRVTLQITAGVSTVALPVRPARAGETPPFGIYRERYGAVPGTSSPAPLLRAATREPSRLPGSPALGPSLSLRRSLEPKGELTIDGIETVWARKRTKLAPCPFGRTIPTARSGKAEAINGAYERPGWKVRSCVPGASAGQRRHTSSVRRPSRPGMASVLSSREAGRRRSLVSSSDAPAMRIPAAVLKRGGNNPDTGGRYETSAVSLVHRNRRARCANLLKPKPLARDINVRKSIRVDSLPCHDQ